MRIVVIGGGAAGLYAACRLDAGHDVTLVEQHSRAGGHADTHRVELDSATGPVDVDSGFIVFNPSNYPLFSAWLDELGVASQPSDMSFGLSCRASGLEYNATSLNRLFCQRRNLVRPRFLGMVRDIVRFYRNAPTLLEQIDDTLTMGEWLEGHSGLSEAFGEDHLIPMASALWSSPRARVLEFPMRYLLEFMRNHDMLQVSGRPEWRTVTGGSQSYVRAAVAGFQGTLRLGARAVAVERQGAAGPVRVVLSDGELQADQVVMACHADQALALLGSPTGLEREILGAFAYESNETVLHTDTTRMPRNRKAWASWNVRRDGATGGEAAISYYMNTLQGLPETTPFIVSLNQTDRIDPARILVRRAYRHPVYTPAVRAAQRRLGRINGSDRVWFSGACWGWGFHEDAVVSAARVVDSIRTGRTIADAA